MTQHLVHAHCLYVIVYKCVTLQIYQWRHNQKYGCVV